MKKLFLFALVIIAISFANDLYAQKFGVKAGLNFANMLMKDDDATYSEDHSCPKYLSLKF